MTCEFCENQATHRGKGIMGPPVFVCEGCSKDLGPAYTVSKLEEPTP